MDPRERGGSTLVLVRTISVARRDRRRRRITNQQARHVPQVCELRLEVLRVREHGGEDPVQFVGPRSRLLRAILVIVRAFRVLLQPRVLSGRFAQLRRGLGFAVHGQAKAVAERRVLGLEGLDARRRVVCNLRLRVEVRPRRPRPRRRRSPPNGRVRN